MNKRRKLKTFSKMLAHHYGVDSITYAILPFKKLRKPCANLGRLERHNKEVLEALKEVTTTASNAFAMSIKEVLGEDPADWEEPYDGFYEDEMARFSGRSVSRFNYVKRCPKCDITLSEMIHLLKDEGVVVVCDDCTKRYNDWARENRPIHTVSGGGQ